MKTVTGNPIVISDAKGGSAAELSVTFEPIQDLHGKDQPYAPDNICSISGINEITVTGGKNPVNIKFGSAGTIYGGTIDILTGLLTVTTKVLLIKYISLNSYSSINTDFIDTIGMIRVWIYARPSGAKPYRDIDKVWCNLLKCDFVKGGHDLSSPDDLWIKGAPSTIANVSSYPYSLFCYLPYGGTDGVQEATTAACRQWLIDNNAELTYELETPQTYQLTPGQLELLTGSNNIEASNGVITLTYENVVEILGYDDDVLYLLSCMAGSDMFDSNFTPISRIGDLLYSYLAKTTPTIYTDPVESRVEYLMKYWLGFESKSSYISLPPRSRVEAILSSKIEGTTYIGEALSDVEKLLLRISI